MIQTLEATRAEDSCVQPPTTLLMSACDTAKALAISERTLWQLTSRNEIPCVRIGRRVLYDPQDLRTWIDRQKERQG